MNVKDVTLVGAENNGVPSDLHFNWHATQNVAEAAGLLTFDQFVKYNNRTGEFINYAISDWEIGSEQVTMEIRDGLVWHDGDAVTSQDLKTHFELLLMVGDPVADFTESVETDGDSTVILNLSEETNQNIIKFQLSQQRVVTKHDVFEKYLDDQEGLETFEWEEDVVGTGPFQLENKDDQQFDLTRFADHPDADNINFSQYRLLHRPGNEQGHQGLLGGELDVHYSLFTPPPVVANFPDRVEEARPPAKWGYGVVFNHDDPQFAKREVRQAIAHLIDRQAVVDNAGPRTKTAAPVPCGITPNDQERWLGDALEQFETYGVDESQQEAAAELLREAGFEGSIGEGWADENGPLSVNYKTPSGWTDWTTATETIVDQLNAFGIDASIDQLPTGDFFNAYVESNFQMGAFYWTPGDPKSAFPYFPLRFQIRNPDIGGGHSFPQEERTVAGMDGGEMTIDPLSEVQTLAQETDEEASKEIVRKLAWHNNQDLPMLSVVGKLEQSWLTSDDWDVPVEEDDPDAYQIKWPAHWLPRTGELQAK